MGYIIEKTAEMEEDVAIAILPDHLTPCEVKTHVHGAIPFLIYHPGEAPDNVGEYNKESLVSGYYRLLEGNQFIKTLLKL